MAVNIGYNLYVQSMCECIDCEYKILHINVKYKARTPNTAMMLRNGKFWSNDLNSLKWSISWVTRTNQPCNML